MGELIYMLEWLENHNYGKYALYYELVRPYYNHLDHAIEDAHGYHIIDPNDMVQREAS